MLPSPLHRPPPLPPTGRSPPAIGGGRAGYCAKVSATGSGRDCKEASCDNVCWDMFRRRGKERL